MEEDRAQTDLGIAADIEEAQRYESEQILTSAPETVETAAPSQTSEQTPIRQPKKRFVGRRAADAAAAKNGSTASSGGEWCCAMCVSITSTSFMLTSVPVIRTHLTAP
uniref:Uncharacterized protein n=1 Tax=Bionectria ochroleuca TaxID=29856 RepID=A0A8H7TRG4_BIOOC